MGFRLEHRIGVAAPAPAVWSVISDLARWGEWNPIYPKIDARLTIGAPVTFELHLPNRPVRTYSGVIVDWVPNTQIVWALRVAGGLVRTTRYFEIEALTDGGCILSNGEIFDGLGAPLLPKAERRIIRRAFELVNEAAKARAEDLRASGEAGA
jgi:hypothetical protein